MDDLISRQAAIDAMEQAKEQYFDRRVIIGKMQDIVNNLPSAEPQRKKGRWVYRPDLGWGETWECSECGEKTGSSLMGYPRYNWCPMCGAEMQSTIGQLNDDDQSTKGGDSSCT